MLKFVVCEDKDDDLIKSVQIINRAMMKYDVEYKILKFKKYDERFQEIIKEPFDTKIYLLDIELPGVEGLEIASEIRENDDNSSILFVTSHPECRNDIFYSRLAAIDFVSKQYKYEERVQETIEYIVNKKLRNKILTFTYNYTTYKVPFKDIAFIEKDPEQSRCTIHFMNDKPKHISRTIKSLEQELRPLFLKTHKSCLVNLENISKVEYANFTIYFKNGESTTLLSPANKKELKDHVGTFEDVFN